MKNELNINWMINIDCNYNCPYCLNKYFISINEKKVKRKMNLEKIFEFFDKINKKCSITISGGEPFIVDGFLEICRYLSKNHKLNIITNLSSDKIYEFSEIVNVKNISLSISLHLTEIKKMNSKDEFIKRYNHLLSKGFDINVTVLMWPPIFPKFKEIYNEFSSKGIIIFPLSFTGEYKNKIYPESYSKKELKIIKKYYNQSVKLIDKRINPLDITNISYSFKGIPCRAGKDHIIIDIDGNVKRCFSELENMGNINNSELNLYKTPRICNAEKCHCIYEGQQFSLGKPIIARNCILDYMGDKNG